MMMNSSNGNMNPSSSSSGPTQSQGLKTYFKTPEGRYKLQFEKSHPAGLLQFNHGKTVSLVFHSTPLFLFLNFNFVYLFVHNLFLFNCVSSFFYLFLGFVFCFLYTSIVSD